MKKEFKLIIITNVLIILSIWSALFVYLNHTDENSIRSKHHNSMYSSQDKLHKWKAKGQHIHMDSDTKINSMDTSKYKVIPNPNGANDIGKPVDGFNK